MTREEERSNGHFREDPLVKSGVCNGSFFVFIYPRCFEHFRGGFFNTGGPLQFSLILIRFFFFFFLTLLKCTHPPLFLWDVGKFTSLVTWPHRKFN